MEFVLQNTVIIFEREMKLAQSDNKDLNYCTKEGANQGVLGIGIVRNRVNHYQ
jgi:hypothetical protein